MPSVTRTAQHGRARRNTVRRLVLETVERLLEQGESFTALGIGRITAEAGVHRSAFYTNFADKTDLLMQLTAAATEELFTNAAEWIASDPAGGIEGLAATQMRSIAVFRQHAAVLSAYAEVAAYDADVARFWWSRIDELVDAFADRIQRGQTMGIIRPTLAPHSTARFIVWGAERTTAQHVRNDDGTGDEILAREMAEAVRAMLIGP